jgi:hypothetical protein
MVLSSIGLRAKKLTLRNHVVPDRRSAQQYPFLQVEQKPLEPHQCFTLSKSNCPPDSLEEQCAVNLGQNNLSPEFTRVKQCALVKRSKVPSLDPSLFRIGTKNRTESKLSKSAHPPDTRDKQRTVTWVKIISHLKS